MVYRSHFFIALCCCIMLVSCAAKQPATEQHISQKLQPNEAQSTAEDKDLACAYFYFLWGTHAEYHERHAEAFEAYEKALICDENADYIKEKLPVILLKMGEFEKAMDWLAQAIVDYPDNNTYRLLLASLYIQEERVEDAVLLYNQVLEKDPENEGVHLRLALLYSHLGRYQMADEIFVKLLKNDIDSYFTHLSYARLLQEMERYQDAAREYEKALSLNWSKELAFEVGYFYVNLQMYDNALRIYTTITDNDPSDERAALSHIQVLLDMERNDEALDELYNLRSHSENPAKIDLIISKVLLRKNEISQAKQILSRLIREHDSSEPRYMLALLAFQEKDYRASLNHLTHIKSENDEFEEAIYLQIRIYEKLDNLDEAINVLKEYMAAESDQNPLFYALLSSLYMAKGENVEAMKLMENAITLYPDNQQLLFEYGLILEKNGKTEQAILIMEQVLEMDPNHAEALNYIGYTLADKNIDLDKALEYILKANKLKPDNGFIIDSLGWAYYRLGDYHQAAKHLERSLELEQNDPHIYDHLGDVYRAQKRFSKAKKVYKKAYELFEDENEKTAIQQKIDALENQ
ncbi:MAG: tetratricopeptide repeat protein [Desulforhopalus sp.]